MADDMIKGLAVAIGGAVVFFIVGYLPVDDIRDRLKKRQDEMNRGISKGGFKTGAAGLSRNGSPACLGTGVPKRFFSALHPDAEGQRGSA